MARNNGSSDGRAIALLLTFFLCTCRTTLDETDEFIVIGCDGIWDCLTNEQAVQHVRSRIDSKTPTEIGKEMLDEIISVDPRVTQGIGGDNMTIMIIDLQPNRRSYRQREE